VLGVLASVITVRPGPRRKPQQHEFSIALDGLNPTSRQVLLQSYGIVDEICFSKRYRHNMAPKDGSAQSARYRFDFRKFRHKQKELSK
jgi:hypothetical protein